ncbi:hypothetical protein ACHAXT_000139 [Thalassiosira profunda]
MCIPDTSLWLRISLKPILHLSPSTFSRYETIVSWLPHGRGFVIGDKPRFETEVLPAFLPHTKYASFTRRLKRWKFVRVSSGIEMGSYYHPHFQRGKPHLVHLINTTDAPAGRESLIPSYAAYPSGGSDEASQGKKRGGGGGGDRMFAAICNPYAGLGAEEGLGLDNDGEEEEEAGKKKRKTKAADEDVQDFPQLMRKISKVKRQENAAARRRREAIRSGSGGLDPSTAMGMGAVGAMGAGYAPYPSLASTGVHPTASGMMPMGGMGGMGSGFMAMTPRYPQPPAAEVADAMMSQMQSSAYRSQYHPSAEARMMMGLGEGGLGRGMGAGLSGGAGAWNPALAGTASQREAAWRQQQAESGMGGVYDGSSNATAAASTDSALGTFASKLPPSPSPTPEPYYPGDSAHHPGYSSQASSGMYGGEGTLSDAERMWMLRREQEQMLQRELMMRKQDPSGKRD